jgi:two-component system OmpR family response regulator
MKILIREDKGEETATLSRCLQHDGHVVETASVRCDTLLLCGAGGYDIVVLEIQLADAKGFDVLRQLKAQTDSPTVIITGVKTSAGAIEKGLEMGADDFITPPFLSPEVSMRMRLRAGTRRNQPGRSITPQTTTTPIGDFVINSLSRQVYRGTSVVTMTTREFAVMECLVRNKGHPVGRQVLFDCVWGKRADPQTNVVEALICRLRKKFTMGFHKQVILTLHNGYILDTVPQQERPLP